MEIKQASPRHCASYNLSKRITLVGDDDDMNFNKKNEACQEFRGQTVLQIEAVHNLRKVRMYLNVLSLRSTS